jgi:hypothetical protein
LGGQLFGEGVQGGDAAFGDLVMAAAEDRGAAAPAG